MILHYQWYLNLNRRRNAIQKSQAALHKQLLQQQPIQVANSTQDTAVDIDGPCVTIDGWVSLVQWVLCDLGGGEFIKVMAAIVAKHGEGHA